jgi:hypothetical protein
VARFLSLRSDSIRRFFKNHFWFFFLVKLHWLYSEIYGNLLNCIWRTFYEWWIAFDEFHLMNFIWWISFDEFHFMNCIWWIVPDELSLIWRIYILNCIWWTFNESWITSDELHLMNCIWWIAFDEMYLMNCIWWIVFDELYLINCIWWIATNLMNLSIELYLMNF